MKKTSANIKELKSEYRSRKHLIRSRLNDFKHIHERGAKRIFEELCFCLLTPQSNARHCDAAIQELKKKALIYSGTACRIRPVLKGKARFHNKKADYIVGARGCFDNAMLRGGDNLKMREALVESVKGLGYKEASHFLRNIGLGPDIAILDRHILKNLKTYGVIGAIPRSLSPRAYLEIEVLARRFAARVGIPLEELDLLFWSRETGGIFK
jgi:N-glycosylase/DNA lyase